MAQTKSGFITLTDINDGVGASVLVVYANIADAATNIQSLTVGTNEFVAYFEYPGDTPTLPIRTGITFVQFVGTGEDGQSERTVYQNGADQPDFPVGGDVDTAPTGWTFAPEESETQRFKSVATFNDGNTTLSQEESLITFSGTTAEVDVIDPIAEVTEIGISGGNSSDVFASAIAEVNQITFAGTSAATGGAETFAQATGTGTSQFFNQVTFGDGKWVGVGSQSSGNRGIYTATSPSGPWVANTTTKPSTSSLADVAYDSVNDRWLAVGSKSGGVVQIWTTQDPAGTWALAGATNIEADPDGAESLGGVIHNGLIWIIVGNDGLIYTAVDPELDFNDASGDGWTEQQRDDLTNRQLKRIAFNGSTSNPLYVAVGTKDNSVGLGVILTATDPTGTWSYNGASSAHGYTANLETVQHESVDGADVWVIGGSGLSGTPGESGVLVTSNPASTTAGDFNIISSGHGSTIRDTTFHNGTWYAVADQGTTVPEVINNTYMKSTSSDASSWDSGLETDTANGGTTNRIRAAHSNGTDLVFGGENSTMFVVTQASSVGSVLTIVGDSRNFANPVTFNIPGSSGALAMRTDIITQFNASTAVTGLTAGIGSTDSIMTITADAADAGVRGNTLSSIANPTGDATTTDSVLTAGTDENGILNQELNFTLGGAAGDPFGTFDDKAPTTLTSGIRNINFGQDDSGNDIYVAVGEPSTSLEGGAIFTSTDAITWVKNTTSPVINKGLNDVAYDGTGKWLAVGDTGTLITATDPAGTWSLVSGHGIGSNPQCIRFGKTFWVVGSNNIYTSTDGTGAWVLEDDDVSGDIFHFGMEYDSSNELFVVVGKNGGAGIIVTSSSTTAGGAMVWAEVTNHGITGKQLREVAYDSGTGVWVAVGLGGKITSTTTPTGTWIPQESGEIINLFGVAAVNGTFFAVGAIDTTETPQTGTIRTSATPTTAGVEWLEGATQDSGGSNLVTNFLCAAFVNSQLIIGGSSNDGIFTPSGSATTLTFNGDTDQFGASGEVVVNFTPGSDGESMVTQTITSLEANTSDLTITGFGDRIQIDSPAGATDTTGVSINGGTATTTLFVRQAGAAGAVLLSSYVFTADSSNHSPETISGDFDANITAAEALVVIRDRIDNGNVGGYTVGTISGTTFSVTSTAAQDESPLSFIITDGTGGTLVESSPVTTNGADGFDDGTRDSWSTTVNKVEYTGSFATQSDGTAQATQQAALLNTAVVLDEVFVATSSGAVLTITARDNGNQFNTITSVTRGTPKTIGGVGAASDADTTPTLTIKDGRVIPDWSLPVQDGFRGGLGLRGAGRHDRSFTVTTQTAPDVDSDVFNAAARCAVAGGYPFNENDNTVTCSATDDINGADLALVIPVEGDVVVLTVTDSRTSLTPGDNITTKAAIHDGTGIANVDWEEFKVQIDGNLLVDGTIVANKLRAFSISAGQIQAGAITIAAVTTNTGDPTLFPGDIGAGQSNTEDDGSGGQQTRTDSRLVIDGTKISIYEGSTLRVVLGDLS